MDDVTSEMWNSAVRKIRQISPLQLVSFRQGNTLPHDFALTGPIKHLDFICPEGYSFQSIDNVTYAAGFITRFIDFVSRGKPIIWSEFGRSCWDAATQSTNRDSFDSVADYHEAYYKMVLESEANGTAPWWWSGGYRVNERATTESQIGRHANRQPTSSSNTLQNSSSRDTDKRTNPLTTTVTSTLVDTGTWHSMMERRHTNRHGNKTTPALLTKATGTTSANAAVASETPNAMDQPRLNTSTPNSISSSSKPKKATGSNSQMT